MSPDAEPDPISVLLDLLERSAEDLIVLKLIAGRPKDEIDLLGLVRLDGLDWTYIERWASEWEVLDRLHALRSATARGS